jgi:hypothetical protein
MNYTPDHQTPTQAAAAAAYYGYEEQRAVEPNGYGYNHSYQPSYSGSNDEAMVRPKLSRETPSYLASPCMASRKQKRGISRRGGACHSDLLKSAVLACMSSQHTVNSTDEQQEQPMPGEDDTDMMMMDEDDASTSWSSSQHTVPELHLPLPPPQQSPRKRVRRNGMAVADEEEGSSSDQEELAIAHASNLLESLCSINPPMLSSLSLSSSSGRGGAAIARNSSSSKSSAGSGSAGAGAAARAGEDGAPSRRQAPVRRVSRRTSYESVISGCNSEEFDEDLM